MAEIPITRSIALYDDELHESFVRASGPGGQNVNKVACSTSFARRRTCPNGASRPSPRSDQKSAGWKARPSAGL